MLKSSTHNQFNLLQKGIRRSLTLLLLTGLFSCTKTTLPDLTTAIEYYPLQVGKFITYRLDSTVYTKLNTQKETRSYLVQDLVEATIQDNLGRTAYRIRRTLRGPTDTTRWTDNATFLVVSTGNKIEFLDNNLRFIKLVNPISSLTTWKGNSFIQTGDDMLRFYENWDYNYDKIQEPYTVNGIIYPETITVNQVDQVDGNPNDKRFYFEVNRSKEVYAKGIGLIYKDFLHETWQPVSASYESNSFGIRLTILNHNF